MDKILMFFYVSVFLCGYSTEFAISKIKNSPNICYNKFVPGISANKEHISNECEVISFQLANSNQINTSTKFSPVELVDHLWSKYFNPELQVNPELSPKIPLVKLKVTPGNLNSSIFNQIRVWHSKEYSKENENVPACICFNFDYEHSDFLKGSELKNFTKNNFSAGWDIIKFKEATKADALEYNGYTILLVSDGEATTTAVIWATVASALAALFYYFFMTGDEGGLKCRSLFF